MLPQSIIGQPSRCSSWLGRSMTYYRQRVWLSQDLERSIPAEIASAFESSAIADAGKRGGGGETLNGCNEALTVDHDR